VTTSPPAREDAYFGDASRRTYLASERTVLAWWRTGLATIAIALGVGRLIPAVAHVPTDPYLALGSAYGLLAVLFIMYGTARQIAVSRALEAGRFEQLHRLVINVLTTFMVLLALATIVLLSIHS
jgi:putative membrane protein